MEPFLDEDPRPGIPSSLLRPVVEGSPAAAGDDVGDRTAIPAGPLDPLVRVGVAGDDEIHAAAIEDLDDPFPHRRHRPGLARRREGRQVEGDDRPEALGLGIGEDAVEPGELRPIRGKRVPVEGKVRARFEDGDPDASGIDRVPPGPWIDPRRPRRAEDPGGGLAVGLMVQIVISRDEEVRNPVAGAERGDVFEESVPSAGIADRPVEKRGDPVMEGRREGAQGRKADQGITPDVLRPERDQVGPGSEVRHVPEGEAVDGVAGEEDRIGTGRPDGRHHRAVGLPVPLGIAVDRETERPRHGRAHLDRPRRSGLEPAVRNFGVPGGTGAPGCRGSRAEQDREEDRFHGAHHGEGHRSTARPVTRRRSRWRCHHPGS